MSWQKNRLLERVSAFSCVTRTFVPLCRPFDDLQRASVLRVTTCVCRNEFMRMGVHTLRTIYASIFNGVSRTRPESLSINFSAETAALQIEDVRDLRAVYNSSSRIIRVRDKESKCFLYIIYYIRKKNTVENFTDSTNLQSQYIDGQFFMLK